MNTKSVKKIFVSMAVAMIVLVTVNACGLMKNKETEQVDHGSGSTEVERTLGTVRSTDDCGFYIEIIKGDLARSLFPINLDAKFQIDGMRLKFVYEEAKAKAPENCPNFEPVSLSDVTPVR